MAHPRRPDTGGRQLVIKPRGRSAAEIAPDRIVQRGENLQEQKHDTNQGEWQGGVSPTLDRLDQIPHRQGERSRQQSAQDENSPPRPRQGAIRPLQDAKELPGVALVKLSEHCSRSLREIW